jgi:hypothetical protein
LVSFFGSTLIQNSSTKNPYKSYFKIAGRRCALHGCLHWHAPPRGRREEMAAAVVSPSGEALSTVFSIADLTVELTPQEHAAGEVIYVGESFNVVTARPPH